MGLMLLFLWVFQILCLYLFPLYFPSYLPLGSCLISILWEARDPLEWSTFGFLGSGLPVSSWWLWRDPRRNSCTPKLSLHSTVWPLGISKFSSGKHSWFNVDVISFSVLLCNWSTHWGREKLAELIWGLFLLPILFVLWISLAGPETSLTLIIRLWFGSWTVFLKAIS